MFTTKIKSFFEIERETAFAEGLAEGRAEGISKAAKKIAENLLSLGMSPEEVAKITNLSDFSK